jgi:hypothetical protein
VNKKSLGRGSVTTRVTEALIKLLKLQLGPKVRTSQVVKVCNQIQREILKNSKC